MALRKDIDWFYLTHDSRAQVYLLWAVICLGGFLFTHYVQRQIVNPIWGVLVLLGLGYMYRVMPLKVPKMRRIMWSWVMPLTFGMAVSAAVFVSSIFAGLLPYLGVFWLLVMAVGFAWNGLVDRPAGWYMIGAFLQVAAAIAIMVYPDLLSFQYVIAAIASCSAMLYLWLFRT